MGDEVCNLHLEAKSGSTDGELLESVVQLHTNQHISWIYQTKDHFTMQVQDIVYINRGDQTILAVYSDDIMIKSFGTCISIGNQPIDSGQLGEDVVLPIGNHSIKLQVTHSDQYGIDIDTVAAILVTNAEQHSCPSVNADTNNGKRSTKEIIYIVCTPIGTVIGVGVLIVSIIGISFACYKYINKKRRESYSEIL